jgi:ABC-type nitrate/sulfonate/bicarbonate transport system ATPase subunit
VNEGLITISKLALRLGRLDLLCGFSLGLTEKKRIGITGPSGCGKTTLFRSIIKKHPPDGSKFEEFQINFGGRRVGYVPQSGGLLPWYSVHRNLRYFAAHKGQVEEVDAYIAEVGAALELTERMSHFPDQLSGGERQRALLACGMATEPVLFLADEPLTEVDLEKKWRLIQHWSNWMIQHGSSLLLISHDIDVLLYLCDEIIVLEGRPARPAYRFDLDIPHPRDRSALIGDEANQIRKALTGRMMQADAAK